MSSDSPSVPPGYANTLFDLSGRVAVVTGGGSGLGQAICIGYAQVGVNVIIADINLDGAKETLATIEEQGGNAIALELDVTQREQCEALAESVSRDHGRVDILVNSAGSAHRCSAEDFPEDRFDYIIALNLKGTYLCCQAFGRIMLKQEKGQHH